MLVLTCRTGEEIVIGHDVRVRVLEILGARVRLGVTAPFGVAIHRQEVRVRIAGEVQSTPGRDGSESM